MKRILLPLIVAALLAGCATPYQDNSLIGGASETKLSATQYQVRFRGNGYTSPARAADYCLLRCAEIALREGYPFFVLVDAGTLIDERTWQQQRSYRTTLQRTGNGSYDATTTGGPVTWHVQRPTADNTIVLLEEQLPNGRAYEARTVVLSLRSKYGIKGPDLPPEPPRPVAQPTEQYTAEEYEAAADKFELEGKTDLAALARERAAEIRSSTAH